MVWVYSRGGVVWGWGWFGEFLREMEREYNGDKEAPVGMMVGRRVRVAQEVKEENNDDEGEDEKKVEGEDDL